MWFNNSRDKEVKRTSDVEVDNILNGYGNIDRNMFFFTQER